MMEEWCEDEEKSQVMKLEGKESKLSLVCLGFSIPLMTHHRFEGGKSRFDSQFHSIVAWPHCYSLWRGRAS